MTVTAAQLRKMAIGKPNASNMNSMLTALNEHGARVGLDQPHRLAHFLPQAMHESLDFRYDREIWGPTPAQKRYDTRTDLGNTPQVDGDGKKNAGRGPFQLTGGYNIRRFEQWCAKEFGRDNVPRFSDNPNLINTDPWEGLSAIWYWDVGNPEGKSLNRYADQNNIEMVTRRINGGLNGFDDRVRRYGRTALVLLGYGTSKAEVKRFQKDHPKAGAVDGDIGQRTRMALHEALKGENPFTETVVPDEVEKEVKSKTNWLTTFFTTGGTGAAIVAFLRDADWQTLAIIGGATVVIVGAGLAFGVRIAQRIKAIRKEINSGAA